MHKNGKNPTEAKSCVLVVEEYIYTMQMIAAKNM